MDIKLKENVYGSEINFDLEITPNVLSKKIEYYLEAEDFVKFIIRVDLLKEFAKFILLEDLKEKREDWNRYKAEIIRIKKLFEKINI